MLINPSISGENESGEFAAICSIFRQDLRQGWSLKIIERQEEVDPTTFGRNQILQQEEFDVASEVLKQIKEVGISCQHISQRAWFVRIVPPYALQGQVKAVLDLPMHATSPIDCGLHVYPAAREDEVAADRATLRIKAVNTGYNSHMGGWGSGRQNGKPIAEEALRIDFAWIASKIDLKRLQVWIGYESIQLTLDTYGHLLADQERDAELAMLASKDLFA